jgi:mannitol/fructose-specific phosphotransferase system IIA component (Ntr-type)
MILTEYIATECVVPNLLVANKAEALKEMTHLLFEQHKLKGVSPALDQIMARETTESTGIGHGIAVPHARVAGLKDLICAVGRVPGGLDFQAVDKNPVHLIFLIVYPPTMQTKYLNFIATLAKLLSDKEHLKATLKAEAADELFKVLEDVSVGFQAPEETYAEQLKADEELAKTRDAHADVILMARLQLCQEMHDAARTGKKQIKQRMENIRGLINPRILKQYDKLMKSRSPALVPVEGDTCQGCFVKLPSQFVQKVRQDQDHLHSCPNCSRFIYIV